MTTLHDVLLLVQAGDAPAAESACLAALAAAPADTDADLSGVLATLRLCRGDAPAAERAARRALALAPDAPAPHNTLGLIRRHGGDTVAAEAAFRRALRLAPAMLEGTYNLAVLLAAGGHAADTLALADGAALLTADHLVDLATLLLGHGEAAAATTLIKRALRRDPGLARGHAAIGDVLAARGRRWCATLRYRQALALDAACVEAANNWGLLEQARGNRERAVALFRQAAQARPGFIGAHLNAAGELSALGRLDEAAAAYRAVLAVQPDHTHAAYMLAALSGGAAPGQAPAAYVAAVYDACASGFEQRLVGELGYDTPARVAALAAEGGRRYGRVIDLGCGTGLAGRALRPLAGTLVGVDLSSGMLGQARAAGIYDELHQADAVGFLARPGAPADLVTAVDMLIYLGDLTSLVAAAAATLAPGGRLILSIEALGGDGDWRLQPSGRYAHAPAYVARLAAAAGLTVERQQDTALRQERGQPVPGCLLLLMKPAA